MALSSLYFVKKILNGANVLTARYVLAIKPKVDGSIKFKAHNLIGGLKDTFKHDLVNDTRTLWTQSAHFMIALAAILGLRLWSTEVKLAYVHSTEPLQRRIFINNPVAEFESEP